MRKMLFASVATAALAFAGGALAQNSAPRLPTPAVAPNSGPDAFLRAAQQDVTARRTGAAEEALERAETRLLDQSDASQPAATPAIKDVTAARDALEHGDATTARQDIDDALTAANTAPPPAPVAAAPATAPASTASAAAGAAAPVPASQMADGIPGANYGNTVYVSPDNSQITYTSVPSN